MGHLSDPRPVWMVANGIGGAVGAALFNSVGAVARSAWEQSPATAMISWALIGGGTLLGIGVGQWLALRRVSSWTRLLLLAEVWGSVVGVVVAVGASAALRGPTGPGMTVALSVAMGSAAFGATQWLVLRGRVAWASQWALASGTGMAAALLFAGIFTFFFAHAIGGVLGAQFGQFGVALFIAMQGLALGVVYGVTTALTGALAGGPDRARNGGGPPR